MCRAQDDGGQRCAAHTRKALQAAVARHEQVRTAGSYDGVQAALAEHASTPTGRREIVARLGSPIGAGEAVELEAALRRGDDIRSRNLAIAAASAGSAAGGDRPVEVEMTMVEGPMRFRPGNNGTGRNRWFLLRDDSVPLADRYHTRPNGDLVRFASMEAAQRAADRLNLVPVAQAPEVAGPRRVEGPRAFHPANNGTGRNRWFLARDESVPSGDRYHTRSDGSLVRFASMEAAQRAAERLNGATPAE